MSLALRGRPNAGRMSNTIILPSAGTAKAVAGVDNLAANLGNISAKGNVGVDGEYPANAGARVWQVNARESASGELSEARLDACACGGRRRVDACARALRLDAHADVHVDRGTRPPPTRRTAPQQRAAGVTQARPARQPKPLGRRMARSQTASVLGSPRAAAQR